jgi:hypothetical protein
MKFTKLTCLLLCLTATTAHAGECEDNFKKSGNPLKGTDFSSSITIPQLSVKDAMGQMRGIMISEKMDVITEDLGTGTMLVEQRSTGSTRAIPTLINISSESGAVIVEMTIKTEKGQFAKKDQMMPYMCQILAKVKGGKEGKLAAAKGAQTKNNDNVTAKDVYLFSREIANEARGNALAVNPRHKGRKYALKGRVDYIQEDGEDYNVSFDIPEQHEMILQVPGNDEPRVGVACLFRPNQLANVLTFRKGQNANFTGSFYRYDDRKRMVWLENCTLTKKK